MRRVAMIGVGNMGEALARGILRAKVVAAPDGLVLCDVRADAAARLGGELGVSATSVMSEAAAGADVVVLAVKPQVMPAVLAELGACVAHDAVVLSIAAGVPLSKLEAALPASVEVVRSMPNTPALVGLGASAYALGGVRSGRGEAVARAILGAVGIALAVPEDALDAVTALSGSGPAYVFALLESMIAAGEDIGLEPDVARRLARQTLVGAAALADSDVPPEELRRRVTSPGGTTAAAMEVLEAHRWGAILRRAIAAARARGEALGRGASQAPAETVGALARARAAEERGEHPVAVLDIDLTIVENMPRTRAVLDAWLRRIDDPAVAQALAELRTLPLVYSIRDNLRTVAALLERAEDEALLASGLSHWRNAFFDSAYLVHDGALEGAVDAVRRLVAAGVTVVYLTARPLSMAAGTVTSMRALGFPVGEPHAILATKPTSHDEEDDESFKVRAMEWCRRLGEVVLLAENEPAHANHMHRAFPSALTVLVGARHRPGAPEPLPGIRRVTRLSDAL